MFRIMSNWLTHCAGAAVAGAFWLAGATGVPAQTIVSTGESFVSARLLPGIREEGGARLMGLRLTLKPGWKTYWRNPGSAGIPPQFDWSESENVGSVQIMWPRPEVFQSFGLQTIGYSERVVFPVRVTPADPAAPIAIGLTADLGVCKELCVLEQVTLSETIGQETPDIGSREIRRAYRSVPPIGREAGLTEMACRIFPKGDAYRFEASMIFAAPFSSPVVLAEGGERLWVNKTEAHVNGTAVEIAGQIETTDGSTWIDRDDLRFTVLDGLNSADIRGCRRVTG